MNCFNLKIISPDKVFFNGSVSYCSIRTPTGKMGFEARHEPFFTVLSDNSEIAYDTESGARESVKVHRGLMAFENNTCTITVYNSSKS